MLFFFLGKFITRVILPGQPVVFIDTDSVPFLELQTSRYMSNPSEAGLVAELLCSLLQGGVDCNSIGIISPYRHQLNVIKDAIRDICPQVDLTRVEVNTVDKYQVTYSLPVLFYYSYFRIYTFF